ncbi:DoxX family protein [Gammaproteobacteria bacterium]|jgi:putative oxidoreductase|nr:DoxX family protein [Gammaproteobacteria bacterium]|tara:strand:+ start:1916 stop:2317 length:402 start_codon:yes stop_codon:yes gene_type:complete
MEKTFITIGRGLLGLYFLYPGITKIPSYGFMVEYMTLHNIPFVTILLPITILLQVVLGLMLITGYRIKESAIILAVLTLFINFGMHDFWNQYPNTDAGHELQNFVKNLGIFAGLLVLSASSNVQQWKLFNKSL